MALSKDPEKRARQLANRRDGPPAPKGNARHMKHGASATPANISGIPKARRELFDAIAASAPVRGTGGGLPPADVFAVEVAATELARYRQVNAWLDEHGFVDRKGRLRPVVAEAGKIASRVLGLLAELGCTPKSRVALGLELARTVSLADAMSEEDPVRRRAMLAELGLPVDGTSEES